MTFGATDEIHLGGENCPTSYHRSAIVRFDELTPAGNVAPHLYVNGSHHALGVDEAGVSVDWEHELRPLLITAPSLGPILHVTTQPDETLSGRLIMAGPSGGGGETRIFFTRPKLVLTKNSSGVVTGGTIEPENIPAASTRLYGEFANLWVEWLLCGCDA